jgi:hypothetical protein
LKSYGGKHPRTVKGGRDPDFLVFENKEDSWSPGSVENRMRCGYSTKDFCGIYEAAPSAELWAGGPDEYVLRFDRDYMEWEERRVFLVYKPVDMPYILVPPDEPANQWHSLGMLYSGPRAVFAVISGRMKNATVPLVYLENLKKPVGFLFFDDLMGVAPPIPL